MPKLKTNRAAAKRFRKTAKGFKRYSAVAAITSATRPARSNASALRRLEPRRQDRSGRLVAAAAASQITHRRITTWHESNVA